MPDDERKAYERYLYNKVYEEDVVETAREDGYEDGFEAGETNGRTETIHEIVQKMKAAGMDPATITQLTGYAE